MILLFVAIIILVVCTTVHPTTVDPYKEVRSRYNVGTIERTILDSTNEHVIREALDEIADLQPVSITDEPNDEIGEGLSTFIPNIYYINLDSSTDRRELIEHEIQTLQCSSKVFRLNAVRRSNGAIGCFLSHLSCLNYAARANEHVLILEDDFQFETDRVSIMQKMHDISTSTENRWDCIVFGQYVHEWQQFSGNVFRILDSTTTSGYLVHKNYADTLFKFFVSEFRSILGKPFSDDYHIDQIQRKIQKNDLWLGFLKPLGGQRPGKSIIGNTFAANSWSASDDLRSFTTGTGALYPLVTRSPFVRKRVAVCNVATGKYSVYAKALHHDMHKNLLKGHSVGFFLFTDSADFGSHTEDGDRLHVYHVDHKPWPYPTLMRYHYMLLGKEALLQYDYMMYVDIDYRVYAPVPSEDVMVNGIFAVKHLHELTRDHVNEAQRLYGSPDTNPASKACIHPNEGMVAYVCGGCQGGDVRSYLRACETISSWIDEDLRNNVMPKWHDESMWNRYVVSNPPAKLLSQSYIFPEECITDTDSNIALLLKKHNIKPIMLPIKKNHKEMRQ